MTRRLLLLPLLFFAVLFTFQNCAQVGPGFLESSSEEIQVYPFGKNKSVGNGMILDRPTPVTTATQVTPLNRVSQDAEFYILAGQSNMEGRGLTSELPSARQVIPSNVFYFDKGVRQSTFGAKGRFGLEVGIAHQLAARKPGKTLVIVKYAEDGSGMQRWYPGAKDSFGNVIPGSGDLYAKMLASLNSVRAQVGQPQGKVAGFFWMQGENDALDYGKYGLSYAYNTSRMFATLGGNFLTTNDYVIVLGRIAPFKTSKQIQLNGSHRGLLWTDEVSKIRADQSGMSSGGKARFVSTDRLVQSDFWHFDSDSENALGTCMGSAYFERGIGVTCLPNGSIEASSRADALISDPAIASLKTQISGYYMKYLKRAPDDDGLKYWVYQTAKGIVTLAQAEAEIAKAAVLQPTPTPTPRAGSTGSSTVKCENGQLTTVGANICRGAGVAARVNREELSCAVDSDPDRFQISSWYMSDLKRCPEATGLQWWHAEWLKVKQTGQTLAQFKAANWTKHPDVKALTQCFGGGPSDVKVTDCYRTVKGLELCPAAYIYQINSKQCYRP